jgi:hypothetical protein
VTRTLSRFDPGPADHVRGNELGLGAVAFVFYALFAATVCVALPSLAYALVLTSFERVRDKYWRVPPDDINLVETRDQMRRWFQVQRQFFPKSDVYWGPQRRAEWHKNLAWEKKLGHWVRVKQDACWGSAAASSAGEGAEAARPKDPAELAAETRQVELRRRREDLQAKVLEELVRLKRTRLIRAGELERPPRVRLPRRSRRGASPSRESAAQAEERSSKYAKSVESLASLPAERLDRKAPAHAGRAGSRRTSTRRAAEGRSDSLRPRPAMAAPETDPVQEVPPLIVRRRAVGSIVVRDDGAAARR